MSDFVNGSSAYGLEYGEFKNLPESTKKKIVKMMARVMERAYRRGVQQAIVMNAGELNRDMYKWRYGVSLNKSIGIDGYKTTSVERLEMEEPLKCVGLL